MRRADSMVPDPLVLRLVPGLLLTSALARADAPAAPAPAASPAPAPAASPAPAPHLVEAPATAATPGAEPPPARTVARPLRVALECEDFGRTKACPTFLLSFVEASRLFLAAPRSDADVVLYVAVQRVALVDHVHLRAVGKVPGAPAVVEADVDLDTRADDDAQRAQLEPAFARAIALFVAAREPGAVSIDLRAPEAAAARAPATSPYDLSLSLRGFGSYNGRYQSYNGGASLAASRLTRTLRLDAALGADGGLNRQPGLTLDDGTKVSLDTTQWSVSAGAGAAYLLDDRWSIGAYTRAWRDDPKGQYRGAWLGRAGVEWDRYKANDPRGNRLAVLYGVGAQVDRYNLPDVLHERFAAYPTHALVADGSIRKDKIRLALSLSLSGELLHPARRHVVSVSPSASVQVGPHVDLSLSLSLSKRELPGPDLSAVAPDDFQQLSRLSYAEPLSMYGFASLSFHVDRTNGARNDRLTDLAYIGRSTDQ